MDDLKMDNSQIPLLEFCEKKQDYHIVNLNYPACITVFRDGRLHCYVEKLDPEPLIGSDGTVYVRSIKEYHEVNSDLKNRNASHSNNHLEIQNNPRNGNRSVSYQKNARIKKHEKSVALAYKKKLSNVNNSIGQTSVARLRFGQVCRFKCLLKIKRNFILQLFRKYSALTAKDKKNYLNNLIYVIPKNGQDIQKDIYFYNIPFKNRLFKICKSCFKKVFATDDLPKINPSKGFIMIRSIRSQENVQT